MKENIGIPFNKLGNAIAFISCFTLEEIDYIIEFIQKHRSEIEEMHKANNKINEIEKEFRKILFK